MTLASTPWERLRLRKLDKRLIWLLLAGGLTLATELGLRSWEAQQKLDAELKSVRGRIQLLQSSADQSNWPQRSKELADANDALLAQLWHAPSEAQAQAMLRDWLSDVLKAPELKRVTITLQPVQAAQPKATRGADADEGSASVADPARSASQRLAQQAVRVRASVNFELAPGALELALQRVERGGQLASIDTLTASRRSRRVEFTVSLPVIIDGVAPQATTASGVKP